MRESRHATPLKKCVVISSLARIRQHIACLAKTAEEVRNLFLFHLLHEANSLLSACRRRSGNLVWVAQKSSLAKRRLDFVRCRRFLDAEYNVVINFCGKLQGQPAPIRRRGWSAVASRKLLRRGGATALLGSCRRSTRGIWPRTRSRARSRRAVRRLGTRRRGVSLSLSTSLRLSLSLGTCRIRVSRARRGWSCRRWPSRCRRSGGA